MIHPNPGMEQYHYIQLQQEQKINWTRSFTIEQQLRYGITPTGEPLDVAMLKEIQMHHNLQVKRFKIAFFHHVVLGYKMLIISIILILVFSSSLVYINPPP